MKPIKGFENYSISEYGDIVSKTGRPLNARISKFGYYQTWLTKGAKTSFKQVHRLVAETYLPNPQNKPEVNHIDGNKLNNHISNLEWVDRQSNITHAWRSGLYKTGSDSPNSKITKQNAIDAISRHKSGESYNSIAKSLGVNHATIRDIVRGKTWKELNV